MSLSVPVAELTGVILGSLLYGVYLEIFTQCMRILRRRRRRPNDYLLGTAVILFIIVTSHMVIDIIRSINAFTGNMGTPYYPSTYYGVYDRWQNIVKNMLYVGVTLVSDALIFYRSFVLWGRNYLMNVIPLLLLLADVVTGILMLYILSTLTPADNPYKNPLSACVKVFGAVTLTLNIMCTCLIALKILEIQRATDVKGGGNRLPGIVVIVVESCSVYSLILLVILVTFAQQSSIMLVLVNALPSIIGIVFSSVIVRIGLGLAHGDGSSHHTTDSRLEEIQMQAAVPASGIQITSNVSPLHYFPHGGIQVALSHTVHTDVGGIFPEDAETEGGQTELKSHTIDVV